jgi:preprotein translocase subunit SecG
MTVFPVLAVGIWMKFVAALWLLSCLLLILIILIQKGRGGGLSGAFGGGMGGGLLGSKTGDFLTWVTIGLVGVFLLLAVILGKFYRNDISVQGTPTRQSVPVTSESVAETNAPATVAPAVETNAPAATVPASAAQPTPSTPAATPTTPAPATATPDPNKPATR